MTDAQPGPAGRGMARLAAAAATWLCLTLAAGGALAQALVRDAEVERALRVLAEPVLRGAGVSPDSVDIYILADRRLNAFVAGGRNIFVNTGMMRQLRTPEQLQAVLAHEVGHINGGHLARRGIEMRRAGGAMALGVLLAIAAGASGSPDAAAAVLSGSQHLLQRGFLAFSRSEESSADQAALGYLERAGINPTGMLEVLEMFRGQEVLAGGHVDPYARTHPLSVDRILLVENRVRHSPHRSTPTPPDRARWFARMQAKLDGFLERPERVLNGLDPDDTSPDALVRRAVALHRLPDPEGAIRVIGQLVAAHPDDPYYQELAGQILMENNRAAEAVAHYRAAVRLAGDEPLIRAGLGRVLVALGDPARNAEAIALLERATREDPGNAPALRDLALAYARAGREGDAALATAERLALQGAFKDVAIHARRAAALFPEGSPGWLKAQDLILVSERMIGK
ncbi:MAG: peptidase M48 [Paracoccaceae bacterium]|nr:MAG: peptidase M48 [Paracoccaceae bacterium]